MSLAIERFHLHSTLFQTFLKTLNFKMSHHLLRPALGVKILVLKKLPLDILLAHKWVHSSS
jgi:hypothetical protein